MWKINKESLTIAEGQLIEIIINVKQKEKYQQICYSFHQNKSGWFYLNLSKWEEALLKYSILNSTE